MLRASATAATAAAATAAATDTIDTAYTVSISNAITQAPGSTAATTTAGATSKINTPDGDGGGKWVVIMVVSVVAVGILALFLVVRRRNGPDRTNPSFGLHLAMQDAVKTGGMQRNSMHIASGPNHGEQGEQGGGLVYAIPTEEPPDQEQPQYEDPDAHPPHTKPGAGIREAYGSLPRRMTRQSPATVTYDVLGSHNSDGGGRPAGTPGDGTHRPQYDDPTAGTRESYGALPAWSTRPPSATDSYAVLEPNGGRTAGKPGDGTRRSYHSEIGDDDGVVTADAAYALPTCSYASSGGGGGPDAVGETHLYSVAQDGTVFAPLSEPVYMNSEARDAGTGATIATAQLGHGAYAMPLPVQVDARGRQLYHMPLADNGEQFVYDMPLTVDAALSSGPVGAPSRGTRGYDNPLTCDTSV